MPNQWVKIVDAGSPDDPNLGRVCPVKHGRPFEKHARDTRTGGISSGMVYSVIDPERFLVSGPYHAKGNGCYALASCVELLGPDECARLDREHGMTGKESES